jgi:uncharacterized phage infection (PIP) family protein YhgE
MSGNLSQWYAQGLSADEINRRRNNLLEVAHDVGNKNRTREQVERLTKKVHAEHRQDTIRKGLDDMLRKRNQIDMKAFRVSRSKRNLDEKVRKLKEVRKQRQKADENIAQVMTEIGQQKISEVGRQDNKIKKSLKKNTEVQKTQVVENEAIKTVREHAKEIAENTKSTVQEKTGFKRLSTVIPVALAIYFGSELI